MFKGGTFYTKLGLPHGTSFPTSPAPEEGDIYYRTDRDIVYTYDGSQWNPIALQSLADLSDVTITNPLNGESLVYDSTISGWINSGISVSGSGATAFTELTDTPTNYAGEGTKYVRVKATEDGLEFVSLSGVGSTFLSLGDTPITYSGHADKHVVVKDTEDGLEFTEFDHSIYTLVDGTRPFTGNQSFGDNDITNVGDIAIDSITPDDTNISINIDTGRLTIEDYVLFEGASNPITGTKGYVGIGGSADLRGLLNLSEGDNIGGSNNFVQLALSFHNTNDYSHFIVSRHDATQADNAIDFYTSDGTQAGVYPTNAVHGLTIRNGNVGIGTTSPEAITHIYTNSSFSDLTGSGRSVSNLFLHRDVTAGENVYGGSIGFSRISGSDRLHAAIAAVQTSSDADQLGLSFFTHPNNSTTEPIVEVMRIDHNGNVGIGTDSPQSRYHLITGDNDGILIDGGGSNYDNWLEFVENYGTADHGVRLFLEGDDKELKIQAKLSGAYTNLIRMAYAGTYANNVGISNGPTAAKLSVGGEILLTSNIFTSDPNRGVFLSGYGDYGTGISSDASDNLELRAGNTTAKARILTNGALELYDANGTAHRFEPGSDGIILRALTNQNQIFQIQSTHQAVRFAVYHADKTYVRDDLVVGTLTAQAKATIDQSNDSSPIPVLALDQAGVNEPFIKFTGSSASGNTNRSIVDYSDVSSAISGGFIKIQIEDVGNQVPDGDYYILVFSIS